jgi:ATP-dependent Lon protease
MEQVLEHALVRQPVAITWEEDLSLIKKPAVEDDAAAVVAH